MLSGSVIACLSREIDRLWARTQSSANNCIYDMPNGINFRGMFRQRSSGGKVNKKSNPIYVQEFLRVSLKNFQHFSTSSRSPWRACSKTIFPWYRFNNVFLRPLEWNISLPWKSHRRDVTTTEKYASAVEICQALPMLFHSCARRSLSLSLCFCYVP